MKANPNLNTTSLSLYDLESDLDTEEYELMRETFRETWRANYGTKFISFSERTLGGKLATTDQYERLLNYVFLCFFVCWLVTIAIAYQPLAFASCFFLWIGIVTIALNLRFTLLKFQFESVEFCYLISSAVFTFCLASSLRDWDLSFTMIRFTYYTTFIAIILFDCLEDRLRRTSKWVLFIGGLSFLINSLRIQFTSQEALVEEGFTIRTYYLGRDTDSWTNLATYCRMNMIQSFFCFKMFYHLHYNVDYSYFITERRRNEDFENFSLAHKDDYDQWASNTFRTYAAFMEKMERKKSGSNKTPRSVRVVAPSELVQEMSEKLPDSETEFARTKSDPTKIALQIQGKSEVKKAESNRVSLTITVTNQEDVSETIIGGPTKSESEAEKPVRTVKFDITTVDKSSKSSESEMYAPWIPRKNLIKFFNACAISLFILHIVNLVMPMMIFDIMTDFCVIAMGSIVALNLKLEYYRIIMYDVEYVYLMISCAAAFYFHCDLFGWRPVRIFRNTYTWVSFAAFAHFDLLVNEMKQTLKYVLGFLVLSIWLLYASYLLSDEESNQEFYTIRNYNISENDGYTNLELWTRICLVMSFFYLKLAYHLWYYFEYFYYNRLLIKLDSFLETSKLTVEPVSPSQLSKVFSVTQTPRDSIVSMTPDAQLTE